MGKRTYLNCFTSRESKQDLFIELIKLFIKWNKGNNMLNYNTIFSELLDHMGNYTQLESFWNKTITWGHRGLSHDEIIALVRRCKRYSSLSPLYEDRWGYSKEAAIYKPGRGSSPVQIIRHLEFGLLRLQNFEK